MWVIAGRRAWCTLLVSIIVAGGLSGCQGSSDPSPRDAASTADAARARRTQQVEKESERLRRERDRLTAELAARGPKATPAPSPKASGKARGTPLPLGVHGSAALTASFGALSAQLGGSEGLAYTTAGGSSPALLGSWRTGPGWSTVKVPLAVAAVRQAHGQPDARVLSLTRRAITASDNAAADQLWTSLGPAPTAAARVQAVLRSAGDGATRVQSQRVRPGFSAFGQTFWSLDRQATFVSRLACLKDSGEVLRLMGEVEVGQRWGIGALGLPARFKGGWGPGPGGGYLVRQMGIVTLADGSRLALAIASEPADGRFETGTANLTAIARWAVAHLRTTGAGGC